MSHALLQRRFNKRVQIPIQHLLRGRGFVIRTQIFNTALVQHVAANLVTPADVGFGVFEFLLGFLLLAQFEVIQP